MDKTNIVMIVCDCLRPEFLGCYGNKDINTPNIDKLAEEGVMFTNAFSQSCWTRPAIASLFTGLYVRNHGVKERTDALDETIKTLAQILNENGYDTIMVCENPLPRAFGLSRGFQRIHSSKYNRFEIFLFKILRRITFGKLSRHFLLRVYEDLNDGKELVKKARNMLSKCKKPFFLYLHLMDTHYPYNLPFDERKPLGELKKNKEHPMKAYLNAIEFMDGAIGELINWVEKNFSDLTIILLADHGDEFYEHGHYQHGYNALYNELIKIPLIIRSSRLPYKGKINKYVRIIDIFPTVLDIVGISYDKSKLDGVSLLMLPKEKKDRTIFCESGHGHVLNTPRKNTHACIIEKDYKYILRIETSEEELYNIRKDPRERENIVGEFPAVREKLRKKLNAFLSKKASIKSEKREFSKDTLRRLRGLGYY